MFFPMSLAGINSSDQIEHVAYIPNIYASYLVEMGVATNQKYSDNSDFVLINSGSVEKVREVLTGLMLTAKTEKIVNKISFMGFSLFDNETDPNDLTQIDNVRQDPKLVKIANELLPQAVKDLSSFIERNSLI